MYYRVTDENIIETKSFPAYYIFFLFGVGGWMAWNAALTGLDYFDSRFKPGGHNPGFVFGVIFNWPLFLANIVLLYLTSKVSLSIRIYIAFSVIIVCTYSMPFITEYFPRETAWGILLFSIVINGIANAFVQGGLFGFASIFPPKYMSAMMVGQGVSGLLLNIIKIILLVALPPDESLGDEDMNSYYDSLIFITFGMVILLSCLVGYKYLLTMDFTRYYTMRACVKEDRIDTKSPIVATSPSEDETMVLGFEEAVEQRDEEAKYAINTIGETTREDTVVPKDSVSAIHPNEAKLSYIEVYKQVWPLAIQAVLGFVLTFLIFPGVMLSTNFDMLAGNKSAKGWFNMTMITLFTLGDTLGRAMVNVWRPFNEKTIVFLTVGRAIFIFTGIAVQLCMSPAWIFQSDWFRIINMLLFAVMNGYNISLIMLFGPQRVKTLDKERAGLIMNFNLIGGVCLGCFLAAVGMDKLPKY